MFRLKRKNMLEDGCMTSFRVVFEKEYTVEKFIQAVLTNTRDWGYIGISNGKSVFGKPCIRYEYGRKIDDFPEDILCKKVTFATANGAWYRMDYLLVIE